MAETVWLNGKFLGRDEARVSAFDAGFVHGVGLFETMLAAAGRVFRLDRHMARLERSARELGLTESLKVRPLAEAVEGVLGKSGLARGEGRARIRLTVTGGDLNMLARTAHGPSDPTILIAAQPATVYPPEMFERGVMVTIADGKANPLDPFAGHKTLNYWWRVRELQSAAAKGGGEALVLSVTNHVCSGCVSNLFAAHSGALLTPMARGEEDHGALVSPVLPGVTRGAVIDGASAMGIGCAKRLVTIADVLDADELFLTNSSWGVLPVTAVEGKPIGDAMPGPLTRRLREKWLEMVEEEP